MYAELVVGRVRGVEETENDDIVLWAVAIGQVSSKPKNTLENIGGYCKGTDVS